MTSRRGFTLIELMVVMAIIMVLVGGSLPIYAHMKKRAKLDQTRVLVKSVGAAISAYSSTGGVWSWMTTSGPRQAPLWDLNRDGLLDGPPDADTGFSTTSQPTSAQASASGYGGFLGMTAFEAPRGLVKNRLLVDGWGNRLRVAYGAEVYGPSQVGVYSCGIDGAPGTADDLRSWTPR
ncbi:MAG: type II secretion system protein [Planctomycetes bacterium]|nr:type II secretion system protein [Planctomycetota bacterium]